MIKPEKNEFLKLSENYGRITVYREIEGDTITPVLLLQMFKDEQNLFLFESANLDKSFSRFSFIGFDPEHVFKTKVNNKDDNFDFLNTFKKDSNQYVNKDFGDFSGGLVGFFSYEAVNKMNVLRSQLEVNSDFCDSVFFLTSKFFVFDNHHFRLYAACNVEIKDNPDIAYNLGFEETEKMERLILKKQKENGFNENQIVSSVENMKMDMEKNEFMENVRYLKTQIENGECIQVVLSNKFQIKGKFSPLDFYRSLRRINPSPYMFYFKYENKTLCGSSPETHLKVKDNEALLKPIAGTYPLSNENQMEELSKKIKNDEKEMAEHLMLLDLARNDLSTVCNPKTVKVTKSFQVERYSHLIHLVSEVTGKLNNELDSFKLFKKTFPAGTVSGAPKVRAMELINEVEESDRGFYAGCVGYFGFDGSLDTCITIRTALFDENKVTLRAGAGIVYDSDPESEFNEVNRKLEALFSALKKSNKKAV